MGDTGGIRAVGWCYENGIGVDKNECKAFEYYMKSADMGDDHGINSVGICYNYGIGVEKNEHKAIEYYENAAKLGNSFGLCNLGECYLNGSGVEKDLSKAFDYFQKSASKKNVIGFNLVGHCYRNGIGTERNLIKANYWFRKERNKCLMIIKSEYKSLNINEQLKKILEKDKYRISWIPYAEFEIIDKIGEGGFATVHRAKWLMRTYYYIKPIDVALKIINGSSNQVEDFIKELKTYCKIGINNPTFLQCYGISQDEKTKNYIIVLKYVKAGSLYNNIAAVSQMKWKDKLNLLNCIISDLESIHSEGIIHSDLYSKNILQDELSSAYIFSLELSFSVRMEQRNEIIGTMPYVAPEVMLGDKYTQSADVYSLGIIMTEIATGKRAFDGETFNTKLSKKICQGKRPEFNEDTPECYIKLAERCMDSDPKKRPTATIINSRIVCWLDDIDQDEDNEIKKQFLEADKVEPINELPIHPDETYKSKIINTQEISKEELNTIKSMEFHDD